MIRIPLTLLICVLSRLALAQETDLINSIVYTKTQTDESTAMILKAEENGGYPEDVKSSGLFFIKIDPSEMDGNPKMYNKINNKLINRMTDDYKGIFNIFNTQFKKKQKTFFLDQGLKYRLIVQSRWQNYGNSAYGSAGTVHIGGGQASLEQDFRVVIKDLETGITYSTNRMGSFRGYVSEFIRAVK